MSMEMKTAKEVVSKVEKKKEISETKKLPERMEGSKEAGKLPEKMEKKQMEPPIEVTFKCPENMDRKEFVRQVKGQERGLNRMNITEWRENRQNYLENGRAPEGAEAQARAREKAYQSRIESNQKKGMSYSEAKKEADTWIKTQAALHNPDQIAGGAPGHVSRMGDRAVNSSIGSQWKSRVGVLDQRIASYEQGKTREELANTKLNVRLNVEA